MNGADLDPVVSIWTIDSNPGISIKHRLIVPALKKILKLSSIWKPASLRSTIVSRFCKVEPGFIYELNRWPLIDLFLRNTNMLCISAAFQISVKLDTRATKMIRLPIVLNPQVSPELVMILNAPRAIRVLLDWRIILMISESDVIMAIFTSLESPRSWVVFSASHVSTINVVVRVKAIFFEVNFKPSVWSTFRPLGCVRSTVVSVDDHAWWLPHVTLLMSTICWVEVTAILTKPDVNFSVLIGIYPVMGSKACTNIIQQSFIDNKNVPIRLENVVCTSSLGFFLLFVDFVPNGFSLTQRSNLTSSCWFTWRLTDFTAEEKGATVSFTAASWVDLLVHNIFNLREP